MLHIQRAWNAPIVNSVLSTIMASAVADVDHARLKAASAPHSGDWLHTPPIASLELKLADDEGKISVALRLEIRAVHIPTVSSESLSTPDVFTAFMQKKHREISALRYVERHHLEVNQKSANSGT